MFVNALAAAIASITCVVIGVGFEATIVCTAFALVASTWWSRSGASPRSDCTGVAALIVAIGLVMQLVQSFPVCHRLVWGNLLPRWVSDCPLMSGLIDMWLTVEDVVSCPIHSKFLALAGIGLCCGLASVRAFATPLRHHRQCLARSAGGDRTEQA
jgi:hypothetical protein